MPIRFVVVTALLTSLLLCGSAFGERVHISVTLSVPNDGSTLRASSLALKDHDGNTVSTVYCDSHGSWIREVCEVTEDLPVGVYRIEGEVDAYKDVDRDKRQSRTIAASVTYEGTISFETRSRDVRFRGQLRGQPEIYNCTQVSCPTVKSFMVKRVEREDRTESDVSSIEDRQSRIEKACDEAGGIVCGGYCSRTCLNRTKPGGILYRIED